MTSSTLETYIQQFTSEQFVRFCAERCPIPPDAIRERLTDYIGEVTVGLRLLDGTSLEAKRVLEVGAGLGLLGVWLRRCGVAVTLLEPGAGGFGANQQLLDATLSWLHATDTPVLPIRAEQLDPTQHGKFDVIYSVNVLEHIPTLEDALDGMRRVLAPGGMMRHTCPNYAVPYEPHYGIPLVPMLPKWTTVLVPRVADEELWQSLNFVTYRRIVRYCKSRGFAYAFDRALLAEAFDRMDRDVEFRRRRGTAGIIAQRLMRLLRLQNLVARLPPRFATPMAFACWHKLPRTGGHAP